jgi:hypothetical protein
MEKRISVVTTRYEGDAPFPEAEHYDAFLAAELARAYPGFEVEVTYGLGHRVQVDGGDDAGRDLEHEVSSLVKVDLWDAFCERGYRAYSAEGAGR